MKLRLILVLYFTAIEGLPFQVNPKFEIMWQKSVVRDTFDQLTRVVLRILFSTMM